MTEKYRVRQIEIIIAFLPIKLAWFLYVIVLQHYGGDESHNWKFDKWQHEVIFRIIDNKTVCINRCRAGSKTRDMSALVIFFRLRGLTVMWYAANRKQLVRAQVYWNENAFCVHTPVTMNKDFIRLKNNKMFQIAVLKKGLNNERGPRANCIFYDEVSGMSLDLIENTRYISGGMDYDGSPIYWIHFSTPKINSSFQEICSIYPTYTNDCSYPSWFTVEYIRLVKKDNSDPKFRQEMMCEFVSMVGSVFDGQLFAGECPEPLTSPIFWGHDPNAREGYVVSGFQYAVDYKHGQFIYTHNFGPGAIGKRLMIEFLVSKSKLAECGGVELETNGVGLPVYDDYVAEGGVGVGMHWDQLSKIRRVNLMNKTKMYVPKDRNKEFNALWNQLNAVSLTKSGDKIDKPADVPWHFADSGMHACQGRPMVWT